MDPPSPSEPDVDAALRAFVEQPVPALPPAAAMAMRERVTRALEARRVEATTARAPSGRLRPWLVFAAAACLPAAIWAVAGRTHGETAMSVGPAMVTALSGELEIEGDELCTGPTVIARASLPSGAVVDVSADSRMRFEATGAGAATHDRVDLVSGRVQLRVPKLAAGADVRVRTDEATVVVHGTKFSVEHLAATGTRGGETRVEVTEGVVTVDTSQGVRTLTAGMELVVPGPTDVAAPVVEAPPSVRTDEPAPASGANASSTLAAENALLSGAMSQRAAHRNARALAQLDELLARYPRSPLAETARVERLRVLEETGATTRLAQEAARYLADYPHGFARVEASRMLAAARGQAP
jgi:hypothetical protein